jgi:hypothetical protein
LVNTARARFTGAVPTFSTSAASWVVFKGSIDPLKSPLLRSPPWGRPASLAATIPPLVSVAPPLSGSPLPGPPGITPSTGRPPPQAPTGAPAGLRHGIVPDPGAPAPSPSAPGDGPVSPAAIGGRALCLPEL